MRLARLLLVGLLLGSGCLFGTGPASADPLPLGQCTSSSGVILAVDFDAFGGGYYRSCGSTPTSGLALLQQGGWSMAGTRQYGNAFVCKIGYSGFNGGTQYPTDFGCGTTPPAGAYWSYWHADVSDNSWTHSTSGASAYSPPAGSVDAWAFGAGAPPSFSPDLVRAHYAVPPPAGGGSSSQAAPPPASAPAGVHTTSPPPNNSGSPAASSSAAQSAVVSSAASSAAAARSSSARSLKVGLPRSAASTSASPTASSASSSPSPTSSPNAAKPGSGSVADFVVGALVIMAVLALVGWQFWHRKQASRYS